MWHSERILSYTLHTALRTLSTNTTSSRFPWSLSLGSPTLSVQRPLKGDVLSLAVQKVQAVLLPHGTRAK